ncbi:unnamed protein product [Prunus armeniaca]|uniref:Uncharacterized protein n=1 Tax=Prunus armeniaca TaxID=36596 RepID=A0A6J5Y0Y0_PRUAR|nr:unnamed protein product [Prunus armeniaca]
MVSNSCYSSLARIINTAPTFHLPTFNCSKRYSCALKFNLPNRSNNLLNRSTTSDFIGIEHLRCWLFREERTVHPT